VNSLTFSGFRAFREVNTRVFKGFSLPSAALPMLFLTGDEKERAEIAVSQHAFQLMK